MMVTEFGHVVEYRAYQLRNKTSVLSAAEAIDMYTLKRNIDDLHPTLRVFTGGSPITLLGGFPPRETRSTPPEPPRLREFAYAPITSTKRPVNFTKNS